jgi:hypothetical protein
MSEVSAFPEKSLAEASRVGMRQAEQMLRRAETADAVPEFGASLDAGRVTGGHVDVLGRTLRQAEPEVRNGLIEQAASLLLVAEHAGIDDFARTVRAEARRLERATDGLDRLERQKRAIRFSSFLDNESGMGRWQASWDPETIVKLESRIDQQLQELFHDRQPDNCPTDLSEKQKYLRALRGAGVAKRPRWAPWQAGSDRGGGPHPTRAGWSPGDRLGIAGRVARPCARRLAVTGDYAHGRGRQRCRPRRSG